MKTNNTYLFRTTRSFIFVSILTLTLMLLYAINLYSSDSQNKIEAIQQEKITVVGKVLDTNNDAIDSVVVKDKNGDIATHTDLNGMFTFTMYNPTVVHFIKFGFQPMKMEIANSDSNLVVVLIPESNEMIVKGFGREMNSRTENKWILDSLSSILNYYPLYIIDDMKRGDDFDIKNINPDNVLSVEVLEDSISKRMYGEEGERGAVKITTKGLNLIDKDDDVPMRLNKTDTVITTLKDKYEIYKDTMKARNKRMLDLRMRGENVFKSSLEKKDSVDTTTFKLKKENNMELKMDTTKVLAE